MSVLVGKSAPDFICSAVLENGEIDNQFRLSEKINGKYGLLFFYPLDFTYVCPSELIALNNRTDEFSKRNVTVIAVSVDSKFTHQAWRKTSMTKGGIGEIKYPLVSDISHAICQAYGIEDPSHVALRGAFLIDKNGIVRSQIVNDLPIGRNIDELIRLFDALQFHEEFGDFCPAGWLKGEVGIKPTQQGVADFLTKNFETL